MTNSEQIFAIFKHHFRLFLVSLVLVFIMVFVQTIRARHPEVVSPKISPKINLQSVVISKLESKPNDFYLQDTPSLVKITASA